MDSAQVWRLPLSVTVQLPQQGDGRGRIGLGAWGRLVAQRVVR